MKKPLHIQTRFRRVSSTVDAESCWDPEKMNANNTTLFARSWPLHIINDSFYPSIRPQYNFRFNGFVDKCNWISCSLPDQTVRNSASSSCGHLWYSRPINLFWCISLFQLGIARTRCRHWDVAHLWSVYFWSPNAKVGNLMSRRIAASSADRTYHSNGPISVSSDPPAFDCAKSWRAQDCFESLIN